jgi:hypothetical protein
LYAFSGQSLPEKIENEIYISLDPLIYEVIKKEDAKLMTGSA